MIKNLSINFCYDHERKTTFSFREHTLQFTLTIALNIEMQSNLSKLCQRSGKPGTRADSISIWLYEKEEDVRRRIWSTDSTPVKDNITNNTARLILGKKVDIVSRKPRRPFGTAKPLLVICILKTEKCIGLKLCLKRTSVHIKKYHRLDTSVIIRF